MANMTFKANLIPNSDLGFELGSSNPLKRWKIHGVLASVALNSTTLNNTAGNFFFSGSGDPWGGSDWVGIQADSGVDKFQIHAYDVAHFEYRQNDSGGTNSTGWGAWQTYVNRAGDSMSGRLTISMSNGWSGVCTIHETTKINLDLDNEPDGNHGLWSSGYYNGSSYIADSKWLIRRGPDNRMWTNGPFIINNTTDVGLNNLGALIIGNPAGTNIGIDDNEIAARNNGTANTLFIQADGGETRFGGTVSPNTDNSKYLGTASLRWNRIYGYGFGQDDGMTIQPGHSNEINFGGTNTQTNIYFGYRAVDSRPIPTKFIFGGSTGTADLYVQTVYLGSGTSSYVSSTYYTGNAASANKIKYSTQLTTKANVDDFREASMLKIAAMSAIDFADSGDLGSNDGIVMSIPWANTNWGHQIYFDDSSYLIAHRFRSNNDSGGYWNKWIKILDTSNYSSTLDSRYVTLSTAQTITAKKTFKETIIAYKYGVVNNLPFMTFDKPGSHAAGIGPDGTSNRIHFGPCDLQGTAWVTSSTFNSNEWHFQGTITGTSTATISGGIISNHGHNFIVAGNEVNFIPDGYNSTFWFNYDSFNRTNNSTITRYLMGNGSHGYAELQASKVYGAVWNDYAEYREVKKDIAPGRCVREVGDGTLIPTTARLQRGCNIVSDTFGFAIGETERCKTPIAVSGRVLAYLYEDRELARQRIGYGVCSGPNGTVSIMTEEEERMYPNMIVGTISEVPDYDIWHAGSESNSTEIKVDGRIWIKVK